MKVVKKIPSETWFFECTIYMYKPCYMFIE